MRFTRRKIEFEVASQSMVWENLGAAAGAPRHSPWFDSSNSSSRERQKSLPFPSLPLARCDIDRVSLSNVSQEFESV